MYRAYIYVHIIILSVMILNTCKWILLNIGTNVWFVTKHWKTYAEEGQSVHGSINPSSWGFCDNWVSPEREVHFATVFTVKHSFQPRCVTNVDEAGDSDSKA